MKSRLVPIIDCDSLIYRIGFASDNSKDEYGNPVDEPLENCLHSLKMSIAAILEAFEPTDKARIFLQGNGNYRDRVATIQPYKGNRDPSKRPRYYDEMRQYLVDYWGAEVVDGMETDDKCVIEQWKHRDRSTCLAHIDKDLDQCPGHHFNFVKKEFYYVNLEEANKKFWTQVLTGDTTDNIRGIPKVGPKTAEKILSGLTDWTDMYVRVRQEYENRGIGNEFHENATLLWLMREPWVNYNGEKIGTQVNKKERGNFQEESVSAEGKDEDAAVAGSPGVE